MVLQEDVTRILGAVQRGEERAEDTLLAIVYDQLRRLAHDKMAKESPGHLLQTTALVHEVYLKLVGDSNNTSWENRRHFFGAAAQAMRRILVDEARRENAFKRGGDRRRVPMYDTELRAESRSVDLQALDEALKELERRDPRATAVVNLRFFVGFSINETAEALGVAPRTVRNDWTVSKTWLRQRLSRDETRSGRGPTG